MAGYIGNKSSVVSSGAERKFKFTITETTTTLSNLAYTRDLVHVFHNGVRLVDGTDYTATNGTSITLTNAAENGDEVVVVSYASFQPSDTVSASLGGTFEGNITVNADLTVSGNTDINGGTIDGTVIGGSTPAAISGTTGTFSGNLTVDTNTLFVDSANNRVGVGTTSPVSLLDIANPSGFINRVIHVTGDINPTGYDAGTSGARVGFTYGTAEVAGIRSGVTNGTGGAETSRLVFSTSNSGLLSQKLCIEANGNVGIGTSSPATTLDVSDVSRYAFNVSNAYTLQTSINAAGSAFADDYKNAAQHIWQSSGSESMRINSAGIVTKPYQPMFLGYPSNDYSGGSMPTGVMGVTSLLNNGGHFNASNSRFTAPVAGWYLTTWGGLQLTNTVTSLMINGTRTHSGNHGVFTGSHITMTQTAIRYLNAGDYLNIEQWNGGGYFNGWYLWSVTLLG